MKKIATLLGLSIAAPAIAHEAGLPHAHTSETTWVPVTVLLALVAVGVLAVLLLRASSKS